MNLSFSRLIEEDLPFFLEVRNKVRDKLHDSREFTLEEAKEWLPITRVQYWVISMDLLKVGYSQNPPEILFRKIEDAEIEYQVEKLKNKSLKTKMETTELQTDNNQKPETRNVKDEIQFDDFAKIDLKVGTILSAEKVEKADKLLKLEVDLGFEKRTIVSGIALHFAPEEIVGKQVTVVCNLAPRKMRGIESNGMILMAEDKAGKLHFINPDNKINEGSGVS